MNKKIEQNLKYAEEDITRNLLRLLNKADIPVTTTSEIESAAAELGVSSSTLRRVAGIGRNYTHSVTTLKTLVTLATRLGVSPMEFFLSAQPSNWSIDELETDRELRKECIEIMECLRKNSGTVMNADLPPRWVYLLDVGMIFDMNVKSDRVFALTDFGLKWIMENRK